MRTVSPPQRSVEFLGRRARQAERERWVTEDENEEAERNLMAPNIRFARITMLPSLAPYTMQTSTLFRINTSLLLYIHTSPKYSFVVPLLCSTCPCAATPGRQSGTLTHIANTISSISRTKTHAEYSTHLSCMSSLLYIVDSDGSIPRRGEVRRPNDSKRAKDVTLPTSMKRGF